jgi:aquaporin NIP
MNPARSLGPALVSLNFHALWVYVVGPIVGAAAGALSYSLIRLPEEEEEEGSAGPSSVV